ncbi:MAG: zinc ribbon domain-containing protein [Burkholderiales bacterium]
MVKIFFLLLLLLLLPVIVVFIVFFIGAKKVQKNRFLWGILGALSFLIPVLVLRPIAQNIFLNSAHASRDDIGALFFSYYVIVSAVGVFVSIMVYKKILLKPAQLTVDQNAFVFCSECGTQCPTNAAFCSKCGYKFSGG